MDEATKQKLLEELSKEYNVVLKPKTDPIFLVKPIIDEYMPRICKKLGIENHWRHTEAIGNGIRKTVCLKYGVNSIKAVPIDKQEDFKNDLVNLIENFILGGK